MKKVYKIPDFEIITFNIRNVLLASYPEEGSIGGGGDVISLDEPTIPDPVIYR